MAKWQPPIPAGALYSKAARAIGPALPLLAYCYDLVQRDGWFDLDLTEAAGDMEEPYPTVKRWWKVVKDGPFFCEAIDRGRRGWRVKFRPVWIDQRILSTRPMAVEPSSTNEGSDLILEEDTQSLEGNFKDISRTNEGSDLILENNVYGTQDSDQADRVGGAKNSRTPPPKNPPTPKPIRDALADVCGIGKISTREQQLQLNQSAAHIWKQQERAGLDTEQTIASIRHTASYFQKHDWRGKKGDRPTPAQIREVWTAAHTNGHRPNGAGPPGDLPLITASAQPTPEERRAAAERRRAILEQTRGK